MPDDKESRQRIQRIESLVRKIEDITDSNLRRSVRELVESILELHGAALDRMMEAVPEEVVDQFANDDLVGNVLLLHGLHPLGFETRVRDAVDKLQSRNTGVELTGIDGGIVRLRLQAQSCGVKQVVEEAIYEAAPDAEQVVIEEPAKNGFVSLDKLLARA